MSEDNTVTNGSGNVFADLGLSEPEIRQKHAENAWRAGESIMATFRDEPDEICVNYVAAVIYDLLRKEARRLSARIAECEAALAPLVTEFDRHRLTFASIPDADADRHILEVEMKLSDLRRAKAALAEGERE